VVAAHVTVDKHAGASKVPSSRQARRIPAKILGAIIARLSCLRLSMHTMLY
jgi:hypothetical protein